MTDICQSCHDPLTLTLDPEDSGDDEVTTTVPDDLLLPCGCHFHWQCLLDDAAAIVASSFHCPSCSTYLPSPAAAAGTSSSSSTAPLTPSFTPPPILTTYTNEGGIQPALDIAPHLAEEAFLTAHPSCRPARAFHTLAAEGDVAGMVDLLTNVDTDTDTDSDSEPDTEPALTAAQLLAWRDPLNGLRSALHVALEARQEEAVWVLLWLGSGAGREAFPPAVVQVAEGMGLPRRLGKEEQGEDVRFTRDERGRAAEEVCLELGEPWTRLVEGGLFLR